MVEDREIKVIVKAYANNVFCTVVLGNKNFGHSFELSYAEMIKLKDILHHIAIERNVKK